MSASRPWASASSGMSSQRVRARRMASAREATAHQVGARAGRVALVEEQDRGRRARRTVRSGSWCGGGTRNGMPALRILRLARTSRCAIVASGTRNARAISGVDMPARVRSVSATWASNDSAG